MMCPPSFAPTISVLRGLNSNESLLVRPSNFVWRRPVVRNVGCVPSPTLGTMVISWSQDGVYGTPRLWKHKVLPLRTKNWLPTAVNVPWSKAANEDGTFRSDAELTALYSDVDDNKDTIAYCRIGERSSHTWFVLAELLGKKNVKNYDGSWTEYGSLIGVPVAIGS